jgi:alpha-L-fucosidase
VGERSRQDAEGNDPRFTRKGSDLYATILGTPKARTATIAGVAARPNMQVKMQGAVGALETKTAAGNLQALLSEHLPGNYAYVLKLAGHAQ